MSTSTIEKTETPNTTDDDVVHAICGTCHPRSEMWNLPPGTVIVAVCGAEEKLWTKGPMSTDKNGIPAKACPLCVEVAEGRFLAACGHSRKDMTGG